MAVIQLLRRGAGLQCGSTCSLPPPSFSSGGNAEWTSYNPSSLTRSCWRLGPLVLGEFGVRHAPIWGVPKTSTPPRQLGRCDKGTWKAQRQPNNLHVARSIKIKKCVKSHMWTFGGLQRPRETCTSPFSLCAAFIGGRPLQGLEGP